jgi:23S rRNA (cytidine1920-2'-O)/16S rRNA (cytidine1409-2'-O)-methyltransferase
VNFLRERRERLDVLLQEKGFFPSREKAKAAVMAGIVEVNGTLETKAGALIPAAAALHVRAPACPYVSRGGLKLAGALARFGVDPAGRVAADIGASTCGFTDCLLQKGARKVYAIDVGYGQLDWKLRGDDRVVNLERVNIRYFDPARMEEKADLITIDISFISLRLALPTAAAMLAADGQIVCLVKPQFEAGRAQVGKNGIVREAAVHEDVIRKAAAYGRENDLWALDLAPSTLRGAKGNLEFLLLLARARTAAGEDRARGAADGENEERPAPAGAITDADIRAAVREGHDGPRRPLPPIE